MGHGETNGFKGEPKPEVVGVASWNYRNWVRRSFLDRRSPKIVVKIKKPSSAVSHLVALGQARNSAYAKIKRDICAIRYKRLKNVQN